MMNWCILHPGISLSESVAQHDERFRLSRRLAMNEGHYNNDTNDDSNNDTNDNNNSSDNNIDDKRGWWMGKCCRRLGRKTKQRGARMPRAPNYYLACGVYAYHSNYSLRSATTHPLHTRTHIHVKGGSYAQSTYEEFSY